MSGYSAGSHVGRISAGEWDTIFAPRDPRIGKVGCVLLHVAGNPREFIDPVRQPSSVKLAAAIASAGIPCIAGDMGGDTFANDTAMSRIDSAVAVLRSHFDIDPDKIALLGGSMGGGAALRYAQLYPSKVACVLGLLPMCDPVDIYDNDRGGVGAEIGPPWGVTYPAPLPAAADIASTASRGAGVPTLFGYSTVDTIVLPSTVLAYAAAVNATTVVIDTTYGHSDAAIGGMPIPTVGTFLAANGC